MTSFRTFLLQLLVLFLGCVVIGFLFGLLILGKADAHERDRDGESDALAKLGKAVFFAEISEPAGRQGCSSCHVPQTGWTHPESGTITARGAVRERFGNRKPPSNAYVTFSPDRDIETRTGGAFWDARADGTALRMVAGLDDVDRPLFGPAADQSVLPFTNPLEHNTTPEGVCEFVEQRLSREYFRAWGKSIDCSPASVEESFARIGLSIVAFEASDEVSPFRSRFDFGALNRNEREGFDLFRSAGCSNCHDITPPELESDDEDEEAAALLVEPGDGSKPLFTDFRTRNIGVPRNPELPFFRMDQVFLDDGTPVNPAGAGFVDVGDGDGRFKTPTLRNVAKRPHRFFEKRFMHNSWFTSLEGVVHFYNTRDVLPRCNGDRTMEQALAENCWPAPEFDANLAGEGVDPDAPGVGDLGLTAEEEAQIVAFLGTLSDFSFFVQPAERRHEDSRGGHGEHGEHHQDRGRHDRHR